MTLLPIFGWCYVKKQSYFSPKKTHQQVIYFFYYNVDSVSYNSEGCALVFLADFEEKSAEKSLRCSQEMLSK